MNKFIALLQLISCAILSLAAVATLINLIFILTRPETISVVNTLIGKGVLIICLLVISRILLRKGIAGFKRANLAADSEQAS